MNRLTRVVVLAACLLLATSAVAQTPEERLQQMEQRMAAMEAELKQYRAANQSNLAAVQADAAERSAVLPSGRFGYDKGFFLADRTNAFQLKVNGLVMARHVYNHNDSTTGDNDESGFQVRRAELYLTGNALDPRLFYQLSGGFNHATGSFGVVTAYAGYQVSKDFELRGGIFKAPFTIEELTGAGRQQASERSFINAYFTAGTTEGVQAQYTRDHLRMATMVHDGSNQYDTEFSADRTDFAVAGRVEWKLAGEWAQFTDFNGWSDAKPAMKLGAAIDYEAGESGDAQDIGDVVKYTLDLTVKQPGWNIFLAAVGKHTGETAAAGQLDQYGLLAQAGVFTIPNRLELFGRYEHVYFDERYSPTLAAIDEHVNIVTVGGNWFFFAHHAKFTLEVLHVFDALPASTTAVGLLASEDGAQTAVRTSFTLFF